MLFADIKSKIIKFYKKEYPQIKIISIKSNKALPEKYKSIKFLFTPKNSYGSIKVDNKYYYIKIKAKIPVYIATQIIKKNSPILPNVIKKEIDFKFFYSKPLFLISPNLLASKIISKNSIITQSNTKKAPAVLQNQIVSVIIKSKNISITTSAKALKDGEIGEYIPIKMNKKIFKAKVIAKSKVSLGE